MKYRKVWGNVVRIEKQQYILCGSFLVVFEVACSLQLRPGTRGHWHYGSPVLRRESYDSSELGQGIQSESSDCVCLFHDFNHPFSPISRSQIVPLTSASNSQPDQILIAAPQATPADSMREARLWPPALSSKLRQSFFRARSRLEEGCLTAPARHSSSFSAVLGNPVSHIFGKNGNSVADITAADPPECTGLTQTSISNSPFRANPNPEGRILHFTRRTGIAHSIATKLLVFRLLSSRPQIYPFHRYFL
jgi:hypothetical protein